MSVKEYCAKNIADEAQAIEGYYPLLEALVEANDLEGANLVKEIISDEKNHLNLLQVIMAKHDDIKIASDDMEATFDFLKKIVK
jgi:rubrerythrin